MPGPKAPEIQQMYSLNMPVSALRTKVRQEFERHRFVQQLPVVDMLIFQSHMEYQVRPRKSASESSIAPRVATPCCISRMADSLNSSIERCS